MTASSPTEKTPPPIARTVRAVRKAVSKARGGGRQIALVPTMGALHAGHLSLIDAAVKSGAYTVVSIYVNPTQFGRSEDLNAYPRSLELDRAACRDAGVDLIFAPDDTVMYPKGDETRVRPGPLAEPLCGPFRPGHFEGVCTVVAKLFNIVQPDAAYFGQKDGQQALVIRRMVEDLHMPIRVEVLPTVREPDGLAMSRRNARLRAEERRRALCLYKALCTGRDMLLSGEQSVEQVTQAMEAEVNEGVGAEAVRLTIDYLRVVDAETLRTVSSPRGRVMLAGAIRLGQTRLIDNLLVDLSTDRE